MAETVFYEFFFWLLKHHLFDFFSSPGYLKASLSSGI